MARSSQAGGPAVCSQPQHGCSSFQREPGADDELGPPPVITREVSRVHAVVAPVVSVPWAP